ncbi:MAG: type II CAAX endopeptidase family protein [Bacteroidota bacterium]
MKTHRNLLIYFALAYAISWVIWTPLWLPHFGFKNLPTLPFHHALGGFGPMIASIIMMRFEKGSAGLIDLFKRMMLWRVYPFWHAVAWFSPFLLLLLAAAFSAFNNGTAINLRGFGLSAEFPQFGILANFLYNFIAFGYGEETGWRGYALPKMQSSTNALKASLLLTIGWAAWHIPLFFYRPGYVEMGLGGIIGWVFSLLTGSILLTWLYNSSRGSILLCAVFHATIDMAFMSGNSNAEVMNIMGALITFWGIAVVAIAKPENLARIERQKEFEKGFVNSFLR